ncbi:MAG: hypothetical protein HYV09_25605 [Deltaproteobacteria bacterium]|nr:hypothetical protein [Deltaproteobacteria bacterium]
MTTKATRPQPALEGLQDLGATLAYDVQTAFNDDTIFFRLSFRSNRGDRHDFHRFVGGKWQKEGGSRRDGAATLAGDAAQGELGQHSTFYESRTTFLVNDPSRAIRAKDFGKHGCYLTCHDGARHMPAWQSSHGFVTKWVAPSNATAATGSALDLWHWRAARSNAIGMADDQSIVVNAAPVAGENGGRRHDAGTKPYGFNELVDGHPEHVFDPGTTFGAYAQPASAFWTTPFVHLARPAAAGLGTSVVPTAMKYTDAVAAGWTPREGDWVPRRILDAPTGSHADIHAAGTRFVPDAIDSDEGTWIVELQRALSTGNADDVDLVAGQTYEVGFAVHSHHNTSRDHWVSLPQRMSLGPAGADLVAIRVAGKGRFPRPDFADGARFPITRLVLFQPGVASWEFLTNQDAGKTFSEPATGKVVASAHPGSVGIGEGKACRDCHDVTGERLPLAVLSKRRGGVFGPTPRMK